MNTKDNRWLTPLHRACASKASSVVEVLLGHQVRINFKRTILTMELLSRRT